MPESYQVTTHAVKVRGIGAAQRELTKTDMSQIFGTHLIFNELLEDTTKIILAMKNGAFVKDFSESELLRSFAEVALKLPANEANFLFTRLFKEADKYNSAENSVKNLSEKTEGKIIALKENYRKEKWKAYFRALPKSAALKKFAYSEGEINLYNKLRSQGLKKPDIETVVKLNQLLAKVPDGLKYVKEEAIKNRKDTKKVLFEKYKTELTPLTELLDHGKRTLECIDKVKQGWYPLSEFYNKERYTNNSDFPYRFADLKQLWHRQIFQQAIEHLKSHFELKEKHALDLVDWEAAVDKLKKDPNLKPYFDIRERLLKAANGLNFKEITPAQFLAFLDRSSDIFPKWSDASLADSRKLLKLKSELYQKLTDPSDQKKVRAQFKRELYASFPEIKELLNIHFLYQKSFASKPAPPTYTATSLEDHPRWLVIPAALWGKIELHKDKKSKKAELKIEMPLLLQTVNGLAEQKTWITVSGDPRLKTLKEKEVTRKVAGKDKKEKEFKETAYFITDKITGQDVEVQLGAIRIEFVRSDKNTAFSSLESDCIFKLTIKRKRPETEEWVKDYYKKKDPLTLEPLLPEKVIVCSFVHDVRNTGTFQAAIAQAPYGDERKLKYLKEANFEVDNIAGAQNTADKRKKLEKLRKLNEKMQLEILEGSLTPQMIKRRLKKIEKRERIIAKGWAHIHNSTDTRSERIASAVVKRVEALRKEYPDYKVVLGIEYRKDFKPKSAWARDFNRLVMSSAGGSLVEKIKQMSANRPEPIAVFGVPVYGLNYLVPSSAEPGIFQYEVDRKSSQPRAYLSENSSEAILLSQKEGKTTAKKVSPVDIVASNIIRRIVQPSRYSNIDVAAIKKEQEKVWTENKIAETLN